MVNLIHDSAQSPASMAQAMQVLNDRQGYRAENMDLSAKMSLRLAFVAFVLVCFNHLSVLSSWAMTQYLFSYDNGFQRRALAGELVSWLFPSGQTNAQIQAIGLVVTFVGGLILLAIMVRDVLPVRGGGAVVIVFVTSIGFATLIGNTGYLAGLLILLTAIALYLPLSGIGVALRAILGVLGVMIHENMLPIFVSLIAAEVYFRGQDLPQVKRISLAVTPLIIAAIAVGVVAKVGTHPHDMLGPLQDAAQARALDFEIRWNAVEPAVAPGPSGRSYDSIWTHPFYYFRLISFAGIGGLFLLAQSVLTWRLTDSLPMLERVVALAAGWAPMSLLFVAFDVSRFVAFALVNSFLMIAILCRTRESCRDRLHSVFSPVVIVVFLVLGAQIELRDLNDENRYQFSFPGRLVYVFFGE